MLIQLVGRTVRGGDDRHPGVEQRGEQPFEDHRVGDVVDLEFVEAQQGRSGDQVAGDFEDRLPGPGPPLPFDVVVNLDHEGVEMNPPLAPARHRAEEQIHQHRFAAADRAAQIEPDRHVATAVFEKAEAGKPAAQPAFRPVMQQRPIKALQLLDRELLRRVGLQ